MEGLLRPTLMRRRALTVCALVLGACTGRETTVVVRTTMPKELRDYVEESFEATHLDVDLRFSVRGDDESLAEARSGEGPAFDVWWGGSALALARAANAGALQAYRPPWADAEAPARPDAEDRWQLALVSPYVIAFNREQLPLTRAPRDWIDLFHFRWADEAHLLDPATNEDGAFLIGALIVDVLREGGDLLVAFDRLGRIDSRAERYLDDPRDVLRALQTGDTQLTILPRHIVEEARGEGSTWLHYRAPESGTPTAALGVGVMAGTAVTGAARRFVDHVGTTDVITATKLHTHWDPAYGEVPLSSLPSGFELDQPWTAYPLAIDTLVVELDGWVQRWTQDVRRAVR